MVGLAHFDSRVSAEMKRLTFAAMEDPAPDPPQRPKVKSAAFEHLGPGVVLHDTNKTTL